MTTMSILSLITLYALCKSTNKSVNTWSVSPGSTCDDKCIFNKHGSAFKGVACFGQHGPSQFPCSQKFHAQNRALTKYGNFVDAMVIKLKKMRVKFFRIHMVGDFESYLIMQRWLKICRQVPDVQFYAYTKRVRWAKSLIRRGLCPDNMTFIYSYGGSEDDLIDEQNDRNVKYYKTERDIKAAGRASVMNDDLVALQSSNNQLGITEH